MCIYDKQYLFNYDISPWVYSSIRGDEPAVLSFRISLACRTLMASVTRLSDQSVLTDILSIFRPTSAYWHLHSDHVVLQISPPSASGFLLRVPFHSEYSALEITAFFLWQWSVHYPHQRAIPSSIFIWSSIFQADFSVDHLLPIIQKYLPCFVNIQHMLSFVTMELPSYCKL